MAKKRLGTDTLPFSKILGEIAKQRKLTIRQIAELAGVGKSVVDDWLAGSNPHDLTAVYRLSRSLGLSFSALLLGELDENNGTGTLSELFEEQELFDGVCKVKLSKLVPRKGRK